MSSDSGSAPVPPLPDTQALYSLARSGARIFPLEQDKSPAFADPAYPGPRIRWLQDDHRARALNHYRNQGLVGIEPGSLGILVVDLDEGGDIGRNVVVAALGPPLETVPSRRPGRYHMLYPAPEGGHGNATWTAGIASGEIRCRNGYVACYDTMAWERACNALRASRSAGTARAPDLSRIGVGRTDAALPAAPQRSRIPIPEAEVRELLSHLNPDMEYPHWRDVGFAIHHEYGDAGYDVFADWSAASAKSMDGKMPPETLWRSFGDRHPGSPITLATLSRMAEHCGADLSAIARKHRGHLAMPITADMFEALPPPPPPPVPQPATHVAVQPAARPGLLRLWSNADCEVETDGDYLVKDLLHRGDLACLFGEPGSGKSMFAPYLGHCVATGATFYDRRVRPGGVFYVAGEGLRSMRRRVRALVAQYGPAPNMHLVSGCADLSVPNSPHLVELVTYVGEYRPSLIVLDTLAAVFGPVDENASDAMNGIIRITEWLRQWGAAVLLIHHAAKSDPDSPRGHGVLNGALDVSFGMQGAEERASNTYRARVRKNREGETGAGMTFVVETQEFGIDSDGDPILGPYAAPTDDFVPPDANDDPQVPLGPTQERMMIHFEKLHRDNLSLGYSGAVSMALLKEAFISDHYAGTDRETRRKRFKNVLSALHRKGLIQFDGDDGVVTRFEHRPDYHFDALPRNLDEFI